MPAGAAYIREERMRLANGVATAALWTENRDRTAANTGTAAARTDSLLTLRELPYDQDIRKVTGDAIHRRFQILPEGVKRAGASGGVYSNTEQDVEVSFVVRIGYHFGAGNKALGDLAQCAEVALSDAEAVRQKLEHPTNRGAFLTSPIHTTGITGGRTVRVVWDEARILSDDAEAGRYLVEIRLRSQLRVTTEVA